MAEFALDDALDRARKFGNREFRRVFTFGGMVDQVGHGRTLCLCRGHLRTRRNRGQPGAAPMNILILGGGGREHALAWAVMQNPKCDKLVVAPGNAGIAQIAECAALDIGDGAAVVNFCDVNAVDFVIVGPEAPLAAGVADRLREAGFLVFGPSEAAARLEASESFTKAICDAAGAPTAGYGHFTDAEAAKAYLETQSMPIVIK